MQERKVKIFWNKLKKKIFPYQTVLIFDFSKNVNPHLYMLFLVDKSMT